MPDAYDRKETLERADRLVTQEKRDKIAKSDWRVDCIMSQKPKHNRKRA